MKAQLSLLFNNKILITNRAIAQLESPKNLLVVLFVQTELLRLTTPLPNLRMLSII